MSREETPKELSIVGNKNWLAEIQQIDDSLKTVEEHVIIPRVKVIQSMSKDWLGEFSLGDTVLDPNKELIATKGTKFYFIPLFNYMSYSANPDIKDASKTMKFEISLDRNSEIARKAANFVIEKYTVGNKEYELKFQTAFNIMVIPFNIESGIAYYEEPRTIICKGGEFKTGKNFASALAQRKVELPNGSRVRLPLWAQVWSAEVETHESDQFEWEGYSFRAQGTIDLEDTEMASQCQKTYQFFKNLHDESRIIIAGGEDHEEEFADASAI